MRHISSKLAQKKYMGNQVWYWLQLFADGSCPLSSWSIAALSYALSLLCHPENMLSASLFNAIQHCHAKSIANSITMHCSFLLCCWFINCPMLYLLLYLWFAIQKICCMRRFTMLWQILYAISHFMLIHGLNTKVPMPLDYDPLPHQWSFVFDQME